MIIHVVQQGETIDSIASLYGVKVDRLIIENGILNPQNLAIGQTIVIIYPLISYTVQEGDTLQKIADSNNISIMQLFRNNPYLSDRNYIYPGENIIISYDTQKIRTIITNGFAYYFINRDILRKTLPFLTYLSIFNYKQNADGSLTDIDDEDMINMAKEYGVAPIMLTSAQSEQGISSLEIANTFLYNSEMQDILFDNIINIMKKKGYYGLNLYFQYYTSERQEVYINYIKKISARLKSEGYILIVTISPRTNIEETEISYEKIDYSAITQYADSLLFLTYNWAFSYGPPASATPVNLVRKLIENITATVPPEKLSLGLPIIGYDWPLPYIPGYTKANAVTTDIAIQIAVDEGVPIQYNDIPQAPYFFYYKNKQELHNVWFRDARSIDAISKLVPEYDLEGLSIWNIMYFFTQMWFVLNNLFDFEKVPDLT